MRHLLVGGRKVSWFATIPSSFYSFFLAYFIHSPLHVLIFRLLSFTPFLRYKKGGVLGTVCCCQRTLPPFMFQKKCRPIKCFPLIRNGKWRREERIANGKEFMCVVRRNFYKIKFRQYFFACFWEGAPQNAPDTSMPAGQSEAFPWGHDWKRAICVGTSE